MKRGKLAKFLVFGSVAAVLFAMVAVRLVDRFLLRSPAHMPYSVGPIPADLRGKSIEFQSVSGTTLRGWFAAGQPGAGAVVLMHTGGNDRLWMLGRARMLAQRGMAVLLFDLQGHGESENRSATGGYGEGYGAQAAVNFLRQQFPGEKLGVIGASMGGAAALLVEPPLAPPVVDALVLEMTPSGGHEHWLANQMTKRLGDWSSGFTPLLARSWQWLGGHGAEVGPFPLDRVPLNPAPKLFIAGALDQTVTMADSRQMFDAATEPKELWVIENAAHVDFHKVAQAEYEQRVTAFFAQYLKTNP